jgi:hypothetical protein
VRARSVPRPVPASGPRPVRRLHHDDGQTTALAAALVGIVLVLVVGITRLGAVAVDRAQARTAADAAALAGVIDELRGDGAGRRAATDVAARNGAQLTGYVVDGTAVEVTVRVDDAHATSRAERALATGR